MKAEDAFIIAPAIAIIGGAVAHFAFDVPILALYPWVALAAFSSFLVPRVEVNIGIMNDDHALQFRSDIGVEGMVMPLVKASR